MAMIHKLILLLVLTVSLFFFSGGAFLAEGTLRGPAVGGALSVRSGRRTMSLMAIGYRPNRTYYKLIAG